jgi:usherin
VTWEEPAFTNGEIINYYINVNGTITIESSGSETDFFVSSLDPRFNHRITFSKLKPFSNYIATVFATNGFGNGTSTELDFMTFTGIPTAPTLLSVTASDLGVLTVTWEEPTSPNGEIINYISVNDGAIMKESSGMGTKFDVSGLEPYTDYNVTVQACTSV